MENKTYGDWYPLIKPLLDSSNGKQLQDFIRKEYRSYNILPLSKDVFRAFRETPLADVRVVILGQSPYPNRVDANGVAFASNNNVMPKTLRQIFTALDKQIGFGRYLDLMLGNLSFSYLTKQGVLMLNSRLTIREGESNSHKNAGWDTFVAGLLLSLSSRRKGICFTAWGSEARNVMLPSYNKYKEDHFFHSCEHPVAASYDGRAWNNKDCFNRINKYLVKTNQKKIIW